MPEIDISPDADSLARAASEQFVSLVRGAIAARGRFSVALSGGHTPRAIHTVLAARPFRDQVDWPRVHVFWGDERCVAPDDPQSNYRMARETLLEAVPLPPGNIHRMHGEDDPARAADAYEQELRRFFGTEPRFDLIFLGMGDNGHTASLFPGTAPIHETTRWVAALYVEEVKMWRVTFTPVVLNAAANVLFLVSGAGKASMLRQVLEGSYQPDLLPSQLVKPVRGRLAWLVDAAAAAQLSPAR